MHLRRFCMLLAAAAIAFSAAGCTKPQSEGTPANPDEELVLEIFAPSETMAIMTDIVYRYSSKAPRVSIKVDYDDGMVQAAKIEGGYACDIYIADEERFMDWLDGKAPQESNPNGNDKILSDTRRVFAEGPGNEAYCEEELAEGEVYTTSYTAAVCKSTVQSYEAGLFIEFLESDEAKEIYETYGFSYAGGE